MKAWNTINFNPLLQKYVLEYLLNLIGLNAD